MRIGIIQFPGSNCERETMLAVKRVGMEPVEFLWNEPREKLRALDGYIIVGGFSYEDRSRAGIIAALDPVMQEVKAQSEQGKPVLGICNGAQILVETGLVPGLENHKVGMVLAENKRVAEDKILGTGYYNAWVHMRLSDPYQRNAFTRHLTPRDILYVPVAHGEGRFIMSPALLQEIEMQGLHVFQYCTAQGDVLDQFPVNPNGSLLNIAAISNKTGNVLAMMPHPERTEQGDPIFQSMRDYISGRIQPPPAIEKGTRQARLSSNLQEEIPEEQLSPLSYIPRPTKLNNYQPVTGAHTYLVELIITDNQALTVQNTLQQLDLPVTVTRQVYWEIVGEQQADIADQLARIQQSGVLFNERKERLIASQTVKNQPVNTEKNEKMANFSLLIRPKEDLFGQQKLQTLRDHFGIQKIHAIQHGILWHFHCKKGNIAPSETIRSEILKTNIIYNPYAHDCYYYCCL
ncbi:MAG TPA: phosphoribosylformylglycinamidine synthase I [Gammaproteobacteria bacterium]|jgi:phosphoribosylformylglycinamidine synthase|nr:phosphoribosylformylglycinamidine synthase I [Gammaproteobacteria bacterium]